MLETILAILVVATLTNTGLVWQCKTRLDNLEKRLERLIIVVQEATAVTNRILADHEARISKLESTQ